MAGRSGAVTIAEVARHAGVSPATVSRVMNGRFLGDPSIAERVRAAAIELDYLPNHSARSLALGRTKAIAFVVPDLANPAFQTILSALSKTAARDGYRVLVADSAESPSEEPGLVGEIRHRCDAIVLCAPRMPEGQLVELAEGLRPLVVINRPSPGRGIPSLSIDYQAGISNLVEHLYALGHRHLVYVAGPATSVSNAHRLTGLDEFGRAHPDVRIDHLPGGVSSEDGSAAAPRVCATGATAAMAFNDLVAIGLLNGLIEQGIRVPEAVSVTGFDDIPFARYTSPPLTTASVSHEVLGAHAWQRMRAVLRDEPPAPDEIFRPQLEARGSTAPLSD